MTDPDKTSECSHDNTKEEGGFLVCQECGMVLEDKMAFESSTTSSDYSDSQRDYERRIKMGDTRAKQDPKIKEHYDKIQTLEKWFRDSKSTFTEQKRLIELLKSYEIGLNIDQVKYQSIKDRYLLYNKKYRKTYQNMVIIFLALVWMEIKDITNVRIERYIEVCNELGHKINKKMLNNAMLKINKVEKKQKKKKKSKIDIEKEIKEKIKILFQKNLNDIPYRKIEGFFPQKSEYDRIKIEMQLLVDEYLEKIPYNNLRNLNYKAFTAGLIYYVGQTLDNRKVFTQSLIEKTTQFSSTTIRKKYQILKELLGNPKNQKPKLIIS